MKRCIQFLLSIFLATLIVYSGSGVNAYSFCCDDCRDEGTLAVTESLCCEIHSHNHEGTLKSSRYSSEKHLPEVASSDVCKVEHISNDWSLFTSLLQKLQPKILMLSYIIPTQCNNHFLPDLTFRTALQTKTQRPPNLSSKTYSALLTILRI